MDLDRLIWEWGQTTVMQMVTRIRLTENYSGYLRGDIRLLDSFNPKLTNNNDTITWLLSLPSYSESVDKGISPGTTPNKSDIESWSDRKGLPEEGISRRGFVESTRRLVNLRGVKGSDFFSVFDERIGLLDKEIYIIVEKDIDIRFSKLQKKYN